MALIESAGAVLYTEDGGVRQYVPVMVDEYPIAGGDVKRVSWFVAHYHDQTPLADPTQVLDVRVLPLREALRLLTYGSTRAILREVDRRLGDVRPRPKNF